MAVSGECIGDDTLSGFVRGELAAENRSRVEHHLSTCADCRGDVAEVARSFDADDRPATVGQPTSRDFVLPAKTEIGRYVIQKVLGVGGMGVVYAAHDTALNRSIALKLLRGASVEGQARLLSEARAMAQLAHPNVVSVHDVGTFNGQVFVAMELVEGSTFRQWLAHTERSWREKLTVLIEAGRGLAAAHAAGIIHRDFKPDNVLVGLDGRVRVTDFGIARSVNSAAEVNALVKAPDFSTWDEGATLTQTGFLKGTLKYMSPEQFAGLSADPRTDQFSFAVAAYESVFDCRPFEASSPAELARLVCAGQVRSPPSASPVPANIRAAILRGLRVEPDQRFESLPAMLDALTSALSTPRSSRVGVGLAAFAVVTAAVIAFIAWPTPAAKPEPVAVVVQPSPPAPVAAVKAPPVEIPVSEVSPQPARPEPTVTQPARPERTVKVRAPKRKPAAPSRYDDAPLEPSFIHGPKK